ncbi:MAG: 5'-methylthioadenosine/adenosylhomocysteine nucleosidase [Verrucomicrobiota bacterium]
MKFGILGAMPQEVALMERSMDVHRTTEAGLRTFTEGTWGGRDVVLALSRVGKVSAAVTTLLMLERFGVTHIIFSGVAGAVDPRLRLGDIVIADTLIQHDMDASPLFPRFEIPLLGKTEFAAPLSDEAFAAARHYAGSQFETDIPPERRAAFGLTRPEIYRGLIVSGDQFLADSGRTSALREALPEALCTEMEGAAVAQVCHEMGGVPFAVIRVISDQADHAAAVNFQNFIAGVAEYLTGGIVHGLLKSFTGNSTGKS